MESNDIDKRVLNNCLVALAMNIIDGEPIDSRVISLIKNGMLPAAGWDEDTMDLLEMISHADDVEAIRGLIGGQLATILMRIVKDPRLAEIRAKTGKVVSDAIRCP